MKQSKAVTVRSSSLDQPSDGEAERGSAPWCRFYAHKAKDLRHDLKSKVKSLKALLRCFEEVQAWKALGYASHSIFCLMECDLSADQIDLILKAEDEALVGATLGTRPGPAPGSNTKAAVLARQGAPNVGPSNNKCKGNTTEYYRARLERDHKDILTRLEAGEFKGVKAAARAAGIVPRTATFYPDDMEATGRALQRHLTPAQLMELRRVMGWD
jgi:hypothetical protein